MGGTKLKKPLSTIFDEALAYASDLHREQSRKGGETPYVGHLLSVAGLVLENGGTETQAIAALLHDAIEDQAGSRGGAKALGDEIEWRFGAQVRQIVEACTDSWVDPKPAWRERKEQYIAHVKDMPKDAVLVSLSDKLHNARAICSDVRQHGAGVFDRFTATRAETLWYYESLAREFTRHHPLPIAAEFSRTVAEMKALP
jgi:(p)ppGpp synthase/HD superfamily hydrolase